MSQDSTGGINRERGKKISIFDAKENGSAGGRSSFGRFTIERRQYRRISYQHIDVSCVDTSLAKRQEDEDINCSASRPVGRLLDGICADSQNWVDRVAQERQTEKEKGREIVNLMKNEALSIAMQVVS